METAWGTLCRKRECFVSGRETVNVIAKQMKLSKESYYGVGSGIGY